LASQDLSRFPVALPLNRTPPAVISIAAIGLAPGQGVAYVGPAGVTDPPGVSSSANGFPIPLHDPARLDHPIDRP
jgi:hypothetical protein